jgi:hypothetical protein
MVSADVRGFVAIARVLFIDVRRVPPKLDPDVPQYVPQFCLDPMESGARHVLLGHTHLPAHSSGGHSTATSLTVPVSTGRPLADVVGTSKTPSSAEQPGTRGRPPCPHCGGDGGISGSTIANNSSPTRRHRERTPPRHALIISTKNARSHRPSGNQVQEEEEEEEEENRQQLVELGKTGVILTTSPHRRHARSSPLRCNGVVEPRKHWQGAICLRFRRRHRS